MKCEAIKARYCLFQSIHVSFICNAVSIHALICTIQAPEELKYVCYNLARTSWADKFCEVLHVWFTMQSRLHVYSAMYPNV